MKKRKSPPSRWPKVIAFVLLGVVVLALTVVGIKSLMGEKSGKPRKPPTVTLLPDKPPPPPPPPKEEKRPEPPKDDHKEVKVVQNVEQAAPQAPSEQLKMEGAAGDGGSPFGSGTVGREYAGGAVGTVGGGGGGMGVYAGRLQRHFQDHLSRNRKLRGSDYRVVVKLWLRRDGSLERAELAGTTGTDSLDELLRESLQQAPAMREPPPENVALPIRIRVTNRGAA
jgi:protein TonB